MYDLKKLRVGDRLVRGKCAKSRHIGIYLGVYSGQHIIAENSPYFGLCYVNFDRFLKGHKLEYLEHFKGSDSQRSLIAPLIQSKIGTHFDLKTYNSDFFDTKMNDVESPQTYRAVFFGNIENVWYRSMDLMDARF
jgi:hypothetical protein